MSFPPYKSLSSTELESEPELWEMSLAHDTVVTEYMFAGGKMTKHLLEKIERGFRQIPPRVF